MPLNGELRRELVKFDRFLLIIMIQYVDFCENRIEVSKNYSNIGYDVITSGIFIILLLASSLISLRDNTMTNRLEKKEIRVEFIHLSCLVYPLSRCTR